eukprot:1767707-Prymnesium_polylepis.1
MSIGVIIVRWLDTRIQGSEGRTNADGRRRLHMSSPTVVLPPMLCSGCFTLQDVRSGRWLGVSDAQRLAFRVRPASATIFGVLPAGAYTPGLWPSFYPRRMTRSPNGCLKRDLLWHNCQEVLGDQFHLSVHGTILEEALPAASLLGSCVEPRTFTNCTYVGAVDDVLTLGPVGAALDLEWHCVPCPVDTDDTFEGSCPAGKAVQLAVVLAVLAGLALLPLVAVRRHVQRQAVHTGPWPKLPRSSLAWAVLWCGWLVVLTTVAPAVLCSVGAGWWTGSLSDAYDYAGISILGLLGMTMALRADDSLLLIRLVAVGWLLLQAVFCNSYGDAVGSRLAQTDYMPLFAQPDVFLPPGGNGSAFPPHTDFRVYAVDSVDFVTLFVSLVA